MNKNEEYAKPASTDNLSSSKESNTMKNKGKGRGKKRKRRNSDSSSEHEDVLAENSVEVDRNLHASAIKNNLDETSVRKIIKKVVTNDRVLALVKMREEEDSGPEENSMRPKLTRAKVKELMKVSPKTTAWNLENLELTPIKHIPVKTRPEVKALIAQELPEDEDDEEYEPTHDDVPSDDDQTLESCSDLDSQPRTPATPRSQHSTSPKVVKDGPFKVPLDISTPARRKLDLEEEATIARRTRSKLSLSATSIEHIESTFVPPDDIPMPAVDDLWNQFLNECLNPASTAKNEDDDETDPEYNVAADPDAHDEDEEALGNSIIKISKKELNDLVTELFNIIPESTAEEELMANNLANSVLTDHSQAEVSTHWEGKQEPISDEENGSKKKFSDRITFEKKNYSRVSIGKSEPQDRDAGRESETAICEKKKGSNGKKEMTAGRKGVVVSVGVQEEAGCISSAPPLLQQNIKPVHRTECVHIQLNHTTDVLPEQVQILQQQLRQHVQLATTNYLQLYVHPIHWSYAAKYKEYIETFAKMVETNPKSVVNVCNLKSALELITTWENTVSENTPENRQMIEYIQSESDRCLRRTFNKSLYLGNFHETFLKVVSNSSVFLYPYLLPSMPYRGDHPRRCLYLHSEDEYIALGMQQFWQYIESNPQLYKPPMRQGHYGLSMTLQLVVKHMLPWMPVQQLHNHVQHVRKLNDKENPIVIYLSTRSVTPVKHKLLPYNPRLTLYEQPEHEVPRIWLRYLAKTSKRFKNYLMKRTKTTGVPANGVEIQLGQAVAEPSKAPMPIAFTNQIVAQTPVAITPLADKFDIQITTNAQQPATITNLYKFVETSTGAYLLPLNNVTMTVNSNSGPITTPSEVHTTNIAEKLPETSNTKDDSDHCTCCTLIRKISKRQSVITEFFGRKEKICRCKEKRYPKISKRLWLLVTNHKNNYNCAVQALQTKLNVLEKAKKDNLRLNVPDGSDISDNDYSLDDIHYVTKFQLKLLTQTSLASNRRVRKRVYNLLSAFNLLEDDPLQLTTRMDKTLGTELVDLYKEFLGFLTPEQADKIYAYKYYFVSNCIMDLVKKVEEQVQNIDKRHQILEEINKVFAKNFATACEICTDILKSLEGYPGLAEYVHSLFPHRKEKSIEQTAKTPPWIKKSSQPTEEPIDETPCNNTNGLDEDERVTAMDYEADQSMSEEEENGGNSESESNHDVDRPIKEENTTTDYLTPTSETLSVVVTVSKTEVQDFSECSNSSLQIMFEEDTVKSESPEWKRDEDKLILEILKEYLTPAERQDKTILEILDEKNIVGMISDSLVDKSKDDIVTRILYLLQIC